ncbi:MAG: DoxX family protein [Sphingomicrobium sp.]
MTVILVAFFLFVGWNKAFASLPDLARYGSWTIWLPVTLGRAVGWSEMVCAVTLGLATPVPGKAWLRRAAGLTLILNQIAAAGFHAAHGEMSAIPQNALLIALLATVTVIPPVESKKGLSPNEGS